MELAVPWCPGGSREVSVPYLLCNESFAMTFIHHAAISLMNVAE